MSKRERYPNDLIYFEASSMKDLYECMKSWQEEKRICFRSLNIEPDGGIFCCIALVSPEKLEEGSIKSGYEEAMARFERKAIRVIVKEKNTGGLVEFVDPNVPEEKILTIQKRLRECTSTLEIRNVFEAEY